ncbi:MAG TPA: hypothetical protein VMB20_02090 [Candidatus Acidoferrum sp.]|nr:hypothetical protein [Candidatus Acidoferrum sp.]
MRIPVPVMLLAVLLTGAAAPGPAPTATPPDYPEIYHTMSRPLCSALATKIQPAVALMIQNDVTIAKSPPLFADYIQLSSAGSDSGRDMSVYRLNQLVTPLVQNSLAIQKLLEDPSVFPPAAHSEDDARLIDLKIKMLKALAAQQASLDIINGFVETQQLGEMQHEGFGYMHAITGQNGTPGQAQGPGPNQQPGSPNIGGSTQTNANANLPGNFDDLVLQAGLSPNQYEFDPTQIPGLQVGYNQIGKLKEGLEWTQGESKKDERPLSQAIVAAAHVCGAGQAPATPSPKP